MSEADSEKVIAHLKTKWGSRRCPMCGEGSWNVQEHTYQLLKYSSAGLSLGGPVIPVVPVVCDNCGNTVLVNAIIADVVRPSPEPSPSPSPSPEGGEAE